MVGKGNRMMEKLNGKSGPGIVLDPFDVRMMSDGDRKVMLEAWECATPKLVEGGIKFGKVVVFGTSR